jgi:hypothetical protein
MSWDPDAQSSSGTQEIKNIQLLDLQTSELGAQSPSPAITSFSNAEGELVVLQPETTWRQQAASEAQIRFLGAMLGTSYQIGPSGALNTSIPGGWIGQNWDEQLPVRQMTAGQASDTLDRVLWGMEMLVKKLGAKGMLCPRRTWFGVGEECDAALQQSRDLEKALRRYYFA